MFGHRYWERGRWRRYLFGDEKLFYTKSGTGSRNVRRPQGSSRYDPQYLRTDYKNPEKLMVWAGISASGRRVIHFLNNNQMMTADLYCETLVKFGAVELLKEDNLILFHDRASVHQAGSVATLLKTEGLQGKFLPGTSADLKDVKDGPAS